MSDKPTTRWKAETVPDSCERAHRYYEGEKCVCLIWYIGTIFPGPGWYFCEEYERAPGFFVRTRGFYCGPEQKHQWREARRRAERSLARIRQARKDGVMLDYFS